MINNIAKFALITTVAAGLSACQTGSSFLPSESTSAGSTALGTAYWRLTDGQYQGKPLLVTGSTVTLKTADGKITGSSGVNTYNANIQINGSHLKVGDIMTTRMAGSAAAMRLESDYLSALRQADNFTRKDDTLTIEGKGSILNYRLTQ